MPSPSRPGYHDPVTERDAPLGAHFANASTSPFVVLGDQLPATDPPGPAALVLTCANCGAQMDERKCKLICRCGYFASCSDYY